MAKNRHDACRARAAGIMCKSGPDLRFVLYSLASQLSFQRFDGVEGVGPVGEPAVNRAWLSCPFRPSLKEIGETRGRQGTGSQRLTLFKRIT